MEPQPQQTDNCSSSPDGSPQPGGSTQNSGTHEALSPNGTSSPPHGDTLPEASTPPKNEPSGGDSAGTDGLESESHRAPLIILTLEFLDYLRPDHKLQLCHAELSEDERDRQLTLDFVNFQILLRDLFGNPFPSDSDYRIPPLENQPAGVLETAQRLDRTLTKLILSGGDRRDRMMKELTQKCSDYDLLSYL